MAYIRSQDLSFDSFKPEPSLELVSDELSIRPAFLHEAVTSSGLVTITKGMWVVKPHEYHFQGTADVLASGFTGDSVVNSLEPLRIVEEGNRRLKLSGTSIFNKFDIPPEVETPIAIPSDTNSHVDMYAQTPLADELTPEAIHHLLPGVQRDEYSAPWMTLSRLGFERFIELVPSGSALQQAAEQTHQDIFGKVQR